MSDEPDDERWHEYRVTPRYLAGSSGIGDPGFEPVSHWPQHSFDDGPCQLMVTSPDHRIKIGWFGDDIDVFRITAAEDAVSPPAWEATFNDHFETFYNRTRLRKHPAWATSPHRRSASDTSKDTPSRRK